MFWILNKTTNEASITGSLTAAAKIMNIPVGPLSYQFSRLKKGEYSTDEFRIVKTEIIRTKHK